MAGAIVPCVSFVWSYLFIALKSLLLHLLHFCLNIAVLVHNSSVSVITEDPKTSCLVSWLVEAKLAGERECQ